jgi:hypothetical protein
MKRKWEAWKRGKVLWIIKRMPITESRELLFDYLKGLTPGMRRYLVELLVSAACPGHHIHGNPVKK